MEVATQTKPVVAELVQLVQQIALAKTMTEETLVKVNNVLEIKVKELVEALGQDGTTGDRLFDLVLRVYGWQPEFLEACRNIEESLKGKQGQFVLIDYSDKVPYNLQTGERSAKARFYRVGLLEGEVLVEAKYPSATTLDGSMISLPVSRFVAGQQRQVFGGDSLLLEEPVDGNIFAYHYHGGLDYKGNQKGNPHSLLQLALAKTLDATVLVGDEAVKRWLEDRSMPGLYKPVVEKLGRILPEMIAET